VSGTQFLRRFRAVVGAPSGRTLELSDFKCQFHVRHADIQTPNSVDAMFYNVSEQTSNLIRDEFTDIVLYAGYEQGAYGLVFKGNIKRTRYGRQNAIDTYLHVMAADGDEAITQALVSATLGAGYSREAVYSAIGSTLRPYGISVDPLPADVAAAGQPSPRGRAIFGMSRDQMRTFARGNDLVWSIQDERLSVARLGQTNPRAIVVDLNSRTGLIGIPNQTQNGIMARALLNPAMRPRGLVRINQRDIATAPFSPAYGAINYFPSIASDGLYHIVAVDFLGDTRGNDWYSDLVLLAVNGTAPISRGVIGMMVTGP
jgi:hypothetical protein